MTRSNRQPFPLLDQVPLALREVVLDFQWDQQRLWALDLPVVEVAVAELAWQLRLPWWALDGRPFALTPEEVAQDPTTYSRQYIRTHAADLRFPLHLLQGPQRMTVLDGVHRLLKAHLLGRDMVQVKKVLPGMLDDIASP